MNRREFFNTIITAELSEEVTEFATKEIASLDKRNAARKDKPSKTQVANAPIRAALVEIVKASVLPITAKEIATAYGDEMTSQKASALLKQAVAEGVIAQTDGKKAKLYSAVTE